MKFGRLLVAFFLVLPLATGITLGGGHKEKGKDKKSEGFSYYGGLPKEVVIERFNRSIGKSPELPNYGNTPDELRPFRSFVRRPYKFFFVTPIVYTGPGRDYPEPDVETVKIGVLAPVYGMMTHEAYLGHNIVKGARLAVEQANKAGGYKGKPFEVIVRNDAGLWGASANEIVAFSYDDKVWAIIGSIDGANTHIAIRTALKTEVPIINVGDTDPTLVETNIQWVFRIIADDRQMCYTIAYHLYKDLGLNRVAILRADNRYGRFGVGEFRDASERMRRPAPIEINYDLNYKNVDPDFKMQVRKMKKVKPEAIVLWADAEPGGLLVKALRRAGVNVPIYACDRVIHPEFFKAVGKYAEGVVAVSPYNPDADDPKTRKFKKDFKERWGIDPDAYAAHGYDAVVMIVEAIRKAGLNRYRIRDELAKMRRYHGVTGEIVLDDAYSDRGPVVMATVRNGKFVYGEPKVTQVF